MALRRQCADFIPPSPTSAWATRGPRFVPTTRNAVDRPAGNELGHEPLRRKQATPSGVRAADVADGVSVSVELRSKRGAKRQGSCGICEIAPADVREPRVSTFARDPTALAGTPASLPGGRRAEGSPVFIQNGERRDIGNWIRGFAERNLQDGDADASRLSDTITNRMTIYPDAIRPVPHRVLGWDRP